jgi:hypothetical protein
MVRSFKLTRTRQPSVKPRMASGITQLAPMQFSGSTGTGASGDNTQIFNGPGQPGAGTSVSFGAGAVVVDPRCAILFYGSAWLNSSLSPSAGQIVASLSSVINNSPYMSGLAGYGVGPGAVMVGECRIVEDNPPNPFSQGDASDVVSDMISEYYSTLDPRFQPNMYAVILPPGVTLNPATSSSGAIINGEHATGDGNYFSYMLFGSLNFITTTFTHEFVECATDPTGDGWQVNPRSSSSWNEICDICQGLTGTIGGVAVSSYFASYVGGSACIIPLPNPPPAPPPVLPNGEYQITIATFSYHNGIAYVGAIGGEISGKQWVMQIQQAIARVQNGELSLYTFADGERAAVSVGHSI